jgi:hypothetical protein
VPVRSNCGVVLFFLQLANAAANKSSNEIFFIRKVLIFGNNNKNKYENFLTFVLNANKFSNDQWEFIKDQAGSLATEDLAELYGIETRRLNEQVARNIDRFPKDFMFRLTEKNSQT